MKCSYHLLLATFATVVVLRHFNTAAGCNSNSCETLTPTGSPAAKEGTDTAARWAIDTATNTPNNYSRCAPLPANHSQGFCDGLCWLFDDCCPTPDQECTANETLEQYNFEGLHECMHVRLMKDSSSNESDYKHISVITKCPQTYDTNFAKEACETPSEKDGTVWLPFTSLRNNRLVFRNAFCAICHNMWEPAEPNWSLVLSCPNTSRTFRKHFLQGKTLFNRLGELIAENCSLSQIPTGNFRECFPHKRTCADGRKCSGSTNYVHDGKTAYRNTECALCNNQSEQSIKPMLEYPCHILTDRIMSPYKSAFVTSPPIEVKNRNIYFQGKRYKLCQDGSEVSEADGCIPVHKLSDWKCPPKADPYSQGFLDELCSLFDDCHQRPLPQCPLPKGLNKNNIRGLHKCTSIDKRDQYMSVINKCPETYANNYIRNACDSPSEEDDTIWFPYVSAKTCGLVFRNAFCAMCHDMYGPNGTLVTPWKTMMTCSNWPDILHVRNSASLPSNITFTGHLKRALKSDKFNCSLTHETTETFRSCFPHRDTCADGGKCLGSTDYVHVRGTAYRNRECALCNHHCELSIKSFYIYPCKLAPDFIYETPPSIEIIMNVQSVVKKILDAFCPTGYKMSESGENCEQFTAEEMFEDIDTFISVPQTAAAVTISTEVTRSQGKNWSVDDKGKQRVELVELGKKEARNQSLVAQSIHLNNLTLSTLLRNSSKNKEQKNDELKKKLCVLIRLKASEFDQLGNGSFYVQVIDRVLREGDYYEGPSTTTNSLDVCRNLFVNTTETLVLTLQTSLVRNYLSLMGQILSLVSLLIVCGVYIALKPLRNLPGKCLFSLAVALFLAQIFFLLISLPTKKTWVCWLIATSVHYFYLAVFFWMSVMSFDVWRTFQFRKTKQLSHTLNKHLYKRFVRYSIFAWLTPLLIVVAAVLFDLQSPPQLHLRPRYAEVTCWLNGQWGLLMFFVIPTAFLLFVNILMFLMTAINICLASSANKALGKSQGMSKKMQVVVCIKLSTVMGLTWVFGYFANSSTDDSAVMWYLFVIFNSLQGVFICIAFVGNRRVLRLIKQRVAARRVETKQPPCRMQPDLDLTTKETCQSLSQREVLKNCTTIL